MQPNPSADTSRSFPSFRFLIPRSLDCSDPVSLRQTVNNLPALIEKFQFRCPITRYQHLNARPVFDVVHFQRNGVIPLLAEKHSIDGYFAFINERLERGFALCRIGDLTRLCGV